MDWLWLRMLGSLLLIVGLIIATLWVLKRFMTFGKPVTGSGVALELAGVLHLAPRRSVYAVKAGGQVILLGVADHSVSFLTQLPESSCTQASDATMHPGTGHLPVAMTPFLRLLSERFHSVSPASAPAADASVSPSLETVPSPAVEIAAAEEQTGISLDPLTAAVTVKKTRTTPAAPRKKAPKQP
ncbi:MAG TPA: flagellar biosynthetic protein FliO [Bacteroidota bacterium]|nr:flagellar biosynthetic protein FliO [Bacteroidota bacterium]